MPRRESLRSYSPCRAGVAQLVEQGTENPRVGSSILSPGTTWKYRACVDKTQALFRIHHPKGRPFPTGMAAPFLCGYIVSHAHLSPPACQREPIPLCRGRLRKSPKRGCPSYSKQGIMLFIDALSRPFIGLRKGTSAREGPSALQPSRIPLKPRAPLFPHSLP